MSAPRGYILADKPAGVTSHDVVARFRRELGGAKVGHAGTLDPFATGLLLILVGPATRLQRYVLGLPKTYRALARLGWRSSTGDPDGELVHTGRIPARLELPTGTISQRVPMTSAVRVGGERLYRKARRGEDIERPVRQVEIMRAALLTHEGEEAEFEIECSSGTYVRTLIEELGDAYCRRLRRIAIGDLRLGGDPERLRPLEDLIGFLPAIELGPEDARLIRNGIRIEPPAGSDGPVTEAAGGPMRLLCEQRLVAVARLSDGRLRTEVVIP